MGLFDVFKKKECCICGNEVGLLGNRKLADGNMCSKCTRKLSPWFEDRRESTMEQIKAQLAYREQNAKDLENFTVTSSIGEDDKIYIEEVNGIPIRFFVTGASDYKEENPDIISFKNVISCVTDIDESERELKKKDSEGNFISYNPPRYKYFYDFYIEMEIRNSPYFDKIRFQINDSSVTIERIKGVGDSRRGFGGANPDIQAHFQNNRTEQRRYDEYLSMCKKIEQMVENGKRATVPAACAAPVQDAPKPKFCTSCGAPYEGGKFCQNCGSRIG